jgi:hypothetical protein
MAQVLVEESSIKSTEKQYSITSNSTDDNTTSTTSGISSRNTSTSSSAMDEDGSITTSSSFGGKSTKSSTSSYSSCNEAAVPGDHEVWGNFVFKFVQPEDYPLVLEHMRESFYRDEPLNAITGYSEAKAKDMDAMVSAYFGDGLSSIIFHKDNNRVCLL